jgi:hypothetical protein
MLRADMMFIPICSPFGGGRRAREPSPVALNRRRPAAHFTPRHRLKSTISEVVLLGTAAPCYGAHDINHSCVLTMRCPAKSASLLRLIGSYRVLRHAFLVE